MSFDAAIRSALRQYATFRGRATRPEFWWWYLFSVLVNVVAASVDQLTDATLGVSFVGALASLGLLIPTLAVSVRRLHDSNLSGWWLLLPFGTALVSLGLLIGGFAATVALAFFDGAPESFGLSIALFAAAGLVLLAAVVLNLVLMLRRSTPVPNRFDPYPDAPYPYLPNGGIPDPPPEAESDKHSSVKPR